MSLRNPAEPGALELRLRIAALEQENRRLRRSLELLARLNKYQVCPGCRAIASARQGLCLKCGATLR